MRSYIYKLSAAFTIGFLSLEKKAMALDSAGSENDFSTVTDNIVTSASDIPDLISTVAYIGGLGLGVAGVFKLKQHVDNPAQTPLKDGLVRLGSGGGLLALPYLTSAMTNTISSGETGGVEPGNVQFKALSFD